MFAIKRLWSLLILAACFAPAAKAGQATIAVASNFAAAAETLETEFETATGHEIDLIYGSTGKIYAQISLGAPYDIFLAADTARPARLVAEGTARVENKFTYAQGRLVLWAPQLDAQVDDLRAAVSATGRLVMANPALAPYGAAAQEVLAELGVWDELYGDIVLTENVGQAFVAIVTGNADAGFVALSSVLNTEAGQSGVWFEIPMSFHTPIRQDAVLLNRAETNVAAQAFIAYLKSEEARAEILRHGYGLE